MDTDVCFLAWLQNKEYMDRRMYNRNIQEGFMTNLIQNSVVTHRKSNPFREYSLAAIIRKIRLLEVIWFW